jgi:hypothetical protein
MPNVHDHRNGFPHLDAPLLGLVHAYDPGWKFDSDTHGPPAWPGDPYLLLHVSFAGTSGAVRGSGTFHCALNRSRWADRSRVQTTILPCCSNSLRARRTRPSLTEAGNDVPWLSEKKHLYLVPGPRRG